MAIEIVEEFVKCNEIIQIEAVGIFARRREVFKGSPVNIFAIIYLLVQLEEIGTFFGSYLCPVFLLAEVKSCTVGFHRHGVDKGIVYNPFVLAN